jgi:hypothetical protein
MAKKKRVEQCGFGIATGGANIKKVGCCVEGFNPTFGWHRRVGKKVRRISCNEDIYCNELIFLHF